MSDSFSSSRRPGREHFKNVGTDSSLPGGGSRALVTFSSTPVWPPLSCSDRTVRYTRVSFERDVLDERKLPARPQPPPPTFLQRLLGQEPAPPPPVELTEEEFDAIADYVFTFTTAEGKKRHVQVRKTWFDSALDAACKRQREALALEDALSERLLRLRSAQVERYWIYPEVIPTGAERLASWIEKCEDDIRKLEAEDPSGTSTPLSMTRSIRSLRGFGRTIERRREIRSRHPVSFRHQNGKETVSKLVTAATWNDLQAAASAQVAREPEEGPYSDGRFYAWAKARLGPGYGPIPGGGTYAMGIAFVALREARKRRYGFDPTLDPAHAPKVVAPKVVAPAAPKPITDAQIEEEVVRLIVRLGSGGSDGLEAFRKELEARYPPLTVEEILRRAGAVRARRRII